jgi:hypothetical protein
MSDLFYGLLAVLGFIFLFLIMYMTYIEPLVDKYREHKRRKTLLYWKKRVDTLQWQWRGNENYNEHVRFTMDFLRNYKKGLK